MIHPAENVMPLAKIKAHLRDGKYADGGYPKYFVAVDGGELSFAAVRENWREVVSAHLRRDDTGGWLIHGVDINYEDPDLRCAHTGERIESAYAEEDDDGVA